ncbi:MAG: hypothetical protein ACFFEF_03745 [Candidatus Thorarchaeota archaeon]
MSDEDVPGIIKAHAPILHFHPDEGEYCCYPTSAEEIYKNYGQRWHEYRKILTPSILDQDAPCYFELWEDEKLTHLRYWFYYNYNRFPKAPLGLGEHAGDWEHVELRIYKEGTIWLLSNHLKCRLASLPRNMTFPGYATTEPILTGNQIHIWVALGSHACYPSPDSRPYCFAKILCDVIEDGGAVYDSSRNLVDLTRTNFYSFTGRWGDSGSPRSPTNDYNNRWRNIPNHRPVRTE